MHEILIKAYADGIVESLKARFATVDSDGPIQMFAAVDLGEDHIEDDIYSVSVKFYWETHHRVIGTTDRSLGTTLHINMTTGHVDIGYQGVWGLLSPDHIGAGADVVTMMESDPTF